MKRQFYFVAAEGEDMDALAAELVLAIKEKVPSATAFGVVGEAMARAGVLEVAGMPQMTSERTAMAGGRRLQEAFVLESLQRMAPRFALLAGYGPFHRRLIDSLALQKIPVLLYGAAAHHEALPHVAALAGKVQRVLGIYPYETPHLTGLGLPYQLIGSPLRDRASKIMVAPELLGLSPQKPIVAFVPPPHERQAFLHMRAIADALLEAVPSAQVIFSLRAEDVAAWVETNPQWQGTGKGSGVYRWRHAAILLVAGMSMEVMRMANVALVGRGLTSLQCALLGTPAMVLAHEVNHKHHPAVVNTMLGQALVPESVFSEGRHAIAAQLVHLIRDGKAAEAQRNAFARMSEDMGHFAMERAIEPALEWFGPNRLRSGHPKL